MLPTHLLLSLVLLIGTLLLPPAAMAHGFGRTYSIPVPVWMYLYGAAAALALSFLLIAWFAASEADHGTGGERDLSGGLLHKAAHALKPTLQGLSLGALVLAITTALYGSRNPYVNFSMTGFWVLFVLGAAYLSVLVGDIYHALNPWRTLSSMLGRLWKRYPRGLLSYREQWGYAPALVLYMAFIWLELEAELDVRGLGQMLLAYSLINLLGVGLIGARDWFRYGEFFAVFLRLFASMAPLKLGPGGKITLRAPFAGLMGWRAEGYGMLLFIMLMMSSTAYDGLRITAVWAELFWVDLYGLLKPWAGDDPIAAYHFMKPLHAVWSTSALLLSPLIYLAIYLSFIGLMKRLTRSTLSLHELAFRFAPSLLPIALVYHAAHYYTLILTQGTKITALLSDPFGWGWDLFGTVHQLRENWLLDAAYVWHSQLALIVGGHIVSVYIAHLVALEIFPRRRDAAISQLPMLILMMLFTAGGLWILAQPIAGS